MNKTKDLNKLYDYYYNELDKLFKEYNPCNIHKNKKGEIVCRSITDGNDGWNKINVLCCQHCSSGYDDKTGKQKKGYWKNGCTIKSLACKGYICYTLKYCKDKIVDEFRGKFFSLRKKITRDFPGLEWCYYFNKEQTLKENQRYWKE